MVLKQDKTFSTLTRTQEDLNVLADLAPSNSFICTLAVHNNSVRAASLSSPVCIIESKDDNKDDCSCEGLPTNLCCLLAAGGSLFWVAVWVIVNCNDILFHSIFRYPPKGPAKKAKPIGVDMNSSVRHRLTWITDGDDDETLLLQTEHLVGLAMHRAC